MLLRYFSIGTCQIVPSVKLISSENIFQLISKRTAPTSEAKKLILKRLYLMKLRVELVFKDKKY